MSEAGIDEEEQKWPTTNRIRSVVSLFATATACLGSQASSATLNIVLALSGSWPEAFRTSTAAAAPSRASGHWASHGDLYFRAARRRSDESAEEKRRRRKRGMPLIYHCRASNAHLK